MNKEKEIETNPLKVREYLSQHILVDGFHVIQDLEKSHGSWIYDTILNREILDFYTSFSTLPLGYNHPKMISESFQKKNSSFFY
jgi:L-lysine 6-transaminase